MKNSTSKRAAVDQTLAAHAALQGILDETLIHPGTDNQQRSPPELPDEYQIQRKIGQGGMGVVYLAHQTSLNREVALKVLRPGERSFGPLVKRFLDEAKHLARLRHPNIVSIHDVGDAHGEPFFTMDYIEGAPLSTEIRRGPMSPTQALAILKQVCLAVQHAHRQGIIHRDLKPSNVLVDRDGTAFVTDFGLARDVSQSSDLTQSGELLGTPQYMSPEQARGKSHLVGEATDVHALGLLLFEMLTGQAAFASSSPADMLVRLLHEDPPRLRTLDRRIPRDLETICQKALQKSPDSRYTSVAALLEDIRRFEAGESLVARRTGVLTNSVRWARRHSKLAATAAIAAVLAILIAAPLLDKSFDELVAWGDEEVAQGNPAVAAQVYTRALRRASDHGKYLLVERIVKTCRAMDDGKTAVDLAMQVIDIAPAESFGQHDYLVARALVAREHGDANLGEVNVWNSKPEPVLKLVKSRLELALEGGISGEQKLRVEEILNAVNSAISDGFSPVRYHPEYLYRLPRGDVPELQQILRNPTTDPWTRGRAGVALGKQLETAGRRDEAIDAYRQAYELVRSVYPMYSGVKVSRGSKSSINLPDAEECLLVKELVDTLHRLDPVGTPLPSGRVEFDVVGFKLPPTVHIELELKMSDPSIKNPNQGLPHSLPRRIPLRQDQPSGATVLDGIYRLHKHQSYSASFDTGAERIGRLLQVDIPEWPDEIEVRGKVVKLPPVKLRLADEIEPQAPAPGAAIKLADAELRWKPISGAEFYRVHLSVRQEQSQQGASMFAAPRVETARLRFADLNEREKTLVRNNLVAGSLCEWHVDAYDAEGMCIGETVEDRRFLVSKSLVSSDG